MNVTVNNQQTTLPEGSTVAALAARLELPEKGVAIAVNNRMVPRTQWDTHPLTEGDSLVVIKAACGG